MVKDGGPLGLGFLADKQSPKDKWRQVVGDLDVLKQHLQLAINNVGPALEAAEAYEKQGHASVAEQDYVRDLLGIAREHIGDAEVALQNAQRGIG